MLKIDTQGYEEKILEGAKYSLKENIFKIIEVELQIGKLYEGSNKNFCKHGSSFLSGEDS